MHSFQTSGTLPPHSSVEFCHAVMVHAVARRLRFPTVSNIVLVSFTLYRTSSSLLILPT